MSIRSAGAPPGEGRRGQAFFRLCAGGVAVAGTMSLLGWSLGRPTWASLGADLIPVAPNTALAFLVLAGILLALAGGDRPRGLGAVRVASGLVVALAAVRLAEGALGLEVQSDRWFFPAAQGRLGQAPLGQMALPTAAGFLLLGSAALLATYPGSRRGTWAGILLSASGLGLGLAFLLGYVYGAPLMYAGGSIPMALLTSACFVMAGAGYLGEAGERLTSERIRLGREVEVLNRSLADRLDDLARLNADLVRSRADLATLVERNFAGLAVVGPDGAVLFANPQACRLLGRDRLEGDPLPFPLADEPLAEVDWEGRVLEVHWEDSHWRDEPARLACLRDVTDRKRALEELDRSREELHQAQKMEAVGRLAGGVAHDFNNLLTAILGYCTLLSEEPGLGREGLEAVAAVERSAERAAALTRQLLHFSRRRPWNLELVDLNDLMRELHGMLGRLIGEDVRLALHTPEEPVRVRLDRGRMEQVVVNLVVNARDAMPGGGCISLETATVELAEHEITECFGMAPGRYAVLRVSDTGSGMDEATRARIFEPFFTTKEPGRGTGLGLSTAYGIVQQLGGAIRVYTRPDRGTTFKIYLPLVESGEEAPADGQRGLLAKGTGTILLVEDEDDLRRLLERVLVQCGYQVLSSPSPEDAERQVEGLADPLHLLLTDLVMPGGSGEELARRLLARRPDLRVLLMSGYSEPTMRARDASGPDLPFLEKPFSPVELVTRIRGLLEPD